MNGPATGLTTNDVPTTDEVVRAVIEVIGIEFVDDLASAGTDFSITPSSLSTTAGTATGNYTAMPNGTPSSAVTIAFHSALPGNARSVDRSYGWVPSSRAALSSRI